MTDTTDRGGFPVRTTEGEVVLRLFDRLCCGGYGRGLQIPLEPPDDKWRIGTVAMSGEKIFFNCIDSSAHARRYTFERLSHGDFSHVLPNGRRNRLDAESVILIQRIWDQFLQSNTPRQKAA